MTAVRNCSFETFILLSQIISPIYSPTFKTRKKYLELVSSFKNSRKSYKLAVSKLCLLRDKIIIRTQTTNGICEIKSAIDEFLKSATTNSTPLWYEKQQLFRGKIFNLEPSEFGFSANCYKSSSYLKVEIRNRGIRMHLIHL